jgi:transposase
VEEFVPEDDPVRYIDSLIDELDLSKIAAQYCAAGRPAFSPQVMVKLLVFGKIRGVRSSRELARACRENLKFIFLLSGEQPDFRTISLFRQRHCKELAEILQQTIVIGLESGVIDLEHVAVDGTFLKSFAGKNSYQTPEQIAKEVEILETSLRQDVEQDESANEDDDDNPNGMLPKRLKDPGKLKSKLRKALDKYEEFKDRPKRDWPKKVSVTDPDSRCMKKGPGYNAQAAVDENSRMVVGGFITDAVGDSSQLTPLLKQIEENTQDNPEKVTADAGYSASHGLQELVNRNIEGYVPQRKSTSPGYPIEKFKYDNKTDTYTCPNNKLLKYAYHKNNARTYKSEAKNCDSCHLRAKCLRSPSVVAPRSLSVSNFLPLINQMKQRTASEIGKKMAGRRSSTVETLFAHIKYARKLRQFLFRGMNMVNNMWKFELAVYNLEQLIKYQMSRAINIH